MTTSASRRARGFTLLEVLAAVAVLAIVYTSLAQAAMQGLANQGDASRRLRASVLADQALGEIEAMLAAGTAPPLGERDLPSPDEDFAIAVEVRAFETLATALAASAPEDAAPPRAPRAADAKAAEPADGAPKPANELLVAAPGAPPPLLEIAVRVHWVEGAIEQEVSRTTFAADPAITDAALASLAKSGDDASQGGDQNGDGAGQQERQDGAGGQPGGVPAPQGDAGEDAEP